MVVAERGDSYVVFLLKGVKIETEGTLTYFSVFFIEAFLGWSKVKKKKVIRSSKCASHSYLPVIRDQEQGRVRQ